MAAQSYAPESKADEDDVDSERLQKYHKRHSDQLKKERLQQLAHCLSALRKPESSDVILICGNRELFAHRIVLEASSPYFVSMFSVGLKESKSGKIYFKEMEPEILEIILDFVYLGAVDKMKSERRVKKVLENAHMMQLVELFNYCCSALEDVVSVKNFSELWETGLKYEHGTLTSKVMGFVQTHITELSGTNKFLQLSLTQIAGLLQFLKGKVGCFHEILKVLVKWLTHDAEGRDKMAAELFAYIDIKLVSKECIKLLLKDEHIMKSSVEIANRMNELGVAIFLSGSSVLANEEKEEQTKNFHSRYQQQRFRNSSTMNYTKYRARLLRDDDWTVLSSTSEMCPQQSSSNTDDWSRRPTNMLLD